MAPLQLHTVSNPEWLKYTYSKVGYTTRAMTIKVVGYRVSTGMKYWSVIALKLTCFFMLCWSMVLIHVVFSWENISGVASGHGAGGEML